MWWMQQQHGQTWEQPNPPHHDGTMHSNNWKYAVYFGTPPLYAVYGVCRNDHRRIRICLIPHFKRDEPNEMFVFERGHKTSRKEFEAIMHRSK
jgi:hypothetical protein